MNVTVLTAADYVDSSTGKLTIVGAFDNFELDDCPALFKPFGVGVKIIAEPRDKGKTRRGWIVLKKARARRPVFKAEISLNFTMSSREKVNAIVIALNLLGVKFESFGKYRLELSVGSQLCASTKLNVVKKKTASSQAQDAPKQLPAAGDVET